MSPRSATPQALKRRGFDTGDELEVDFAAGTVANLSKGSAQRLDAMAPDLRAIVTAGGTRGLLKTWLDAHPELSRPRVAPG